MVILQKAWYAVIILQRFQLVSQKFQRFTDLLVVVMRWEAATGEGWCCDRGNFPSSRVSGSWQDVSVLANARSGLVSDFQRPE